MKAWLKYGPGRIGSTYLRGVYFAYLLKTRPLARVLHLAGVSAPLRGLEQLSPEEAAALVARVFRRRSLPLASRCLVRSLVLYSLLNSSGGQVRLHLGMSHQARRKPSGHAWVTWRGRPLLPEDRLAAEQYEEFLIWPEGGDDA